MHVLAVHVYPSPARPHFIARERLRAGTYVRVGSTNHLADAPMIAEMERFAAGDSFDEQPLPALDSEAVDFRVASEFFAPARRRDPKRRYVSRAPGRGQSATVRRHGIGAVERNERQVAGFQQLACHPQRYATAAR